VQKAIAYSRARFIGAAYFLLMLLLLLRCRSAPRLRGLATRASSRYWVQLLAFAPMFILLLGGRRITNKKKGQCLSLKYDQSIQD